ncbi:hypothetical protein J6590_037254 [Homalodisca vitripennis]|nr:hypothetical protein J6590_037254 [Homalodisca vitripennis]
MLSQFPWNNQAPASEPCRRVQKVDKSQPPRPPRHFKHVGINRAFLLALPSEKQVDNNRELVQDLVQTPGHGGGHRPPAPSWRSGGSGRTTFYHPHRCHQSTSNSHGFGQVATYMYVDVGQSRRDGRGGAIIDFLANVLSYGDGSSCETDQCQSECLL